MVAPSLFFLAFPAGFLSFLSPCVLPLVIPYLCFLTGVSFESLSLEGKKIQRKTSHNILWCAVFFVAGFSTVFTILGASATVLGGMLRETATWSIPFGGSQLLLSQIVAGTTIILMGLHFTRILNFSFLLREKRYVPSAPPGPLGAFSIGLAFAFGWTPCIGPILASILSVAALEESSLKGAFLLFLYSFGLGVPFLLAAWGVENFSTFTHRAKKYVYFFEKTTGILLIMIGVIVFTNGFSIFSSFLLRIAPWLGFLG